jgi:hypothetical protein
MADTMAGIFDIGLYMLLHNNFMVQPLGMLEIGKQLSLGRNIDDARACI